MKDITEYFMDPIKFGEDTTVNSDKNSKDGNVSENSSRAKRNRVKIKISRRNTEERVCDIIESNNDMIDKTPSPFAKLNSIDKERLHDGTPRRHSLSNMALKSNFKALQSQRMSPSKSPLEPDNNSNIKHKDRKAKSGSGNSVVLQKKNKGKLIDKTNIISDVSLNSISNSDRDVEIINLSTDSDDDDNTQSEGSNAFQILMSRSKPTQSPSPTKRDDDLNVKMSEESKEKLRATKQKLIALADKKGYSKRKLAEVEDGEKIERIIQNRIKLFKGENKKVNNTEVPVVNQRHSSSSLLNYFSKAPTELTPKDMVQLSTFVVKADVHVSESSVTHSLYKSKSIKNGNHLTKKTRKSSVELSQVDDIKVIASENINIINDQQDQDLHQEYNKRRWSLRIKLQTNEEKDASTGGSSDEEIFSPRSKVKRVSENSKKIETSMITSSKETEELLTKHVNKNSVKQVNSRSKLKLKRSQQKDNATQDNNNLKDKSYNTQKTGTVEKFKEIVTEMSRTNSMENNDISLSNTNNIKLNHENCKIPNDNSHKRKSNEKLAPLFTKRRKADPDAVAARRLFLKPNMTENNNKTTERKVHITGVLPFPGISHVTQLKDTGLDEPINIGVPIKIHSQYTPVLDVSSYKCVMDYADTNSKSLKNISKPDVQEVLNEIEAYCSDARKIWNTISLVSKEQSNKRSSPKVRKRGKQSERKEMTEYKNKAHESQSSIWTYKYKPKRTEEIIGNEEAALKLREWLDGWRASLTKLDVSSGDEFYSSDCSYSNSNENNQVAILLGPHGSGKSASVYAVAEELGYTVLEVNASSRRTGKKLLKELEEATKSHRIKKDKGMNAFINTVPDEAASKKIPQNSLILLEDIDLIFEEDEGFISATYQLASNTKRPIVMTCRDVCPHLSRMAPQQNKIYFQTVVGNRVSALLELISLAETGYRLSHGCIAELLKSGDLRKALLQLQYLSVSGPPQILDQSINPTNSLWQNMRYCLYKPIIKASKKSKSKKNVKIETANTNTINVLDNIASKIDNIALLSCLIDVQDAALNLSCIKMQPSMSLVEDTTPYSNSNSVSSDIANWISKKVMCNGQLSDHDRTSHQNHITLKKNLYKGVDVALSQATTLLLDHRIMSVDYLPSVRAICRAEECRVNINNKRGNRFFHYLQNLKIPATSLKPNILAAASKIMYDKVNEERACNSNANVA